MANSLRNVLASGRRRMPRPPKPEGFGVPSKFINKDQVLAIELAENVGAQVPVAKLMEQLDESKVYDAFTKIMRGE